jgi:hypothetical protein
MSTEERLEQVAEACADFAVEHELTAITALAEIDGRQFYVEVVNGDELKTDTREFKL